MLLDSDYPGLKTRANRDGTERAYWVASAEAVKRGYTPKTVRLHYDLDDPAQALLASAACRRCHAEMLAWMAGQRQDYMTFDGTIGTLVRLYQRDEASPYHGIKYNTRRTYDQILDVIVKAFGKRSLAALGIRDFRRWYEEAKKPKKPGGPERVNKAHKIVSMLRRLFGYGVMAELPGCARLCAILDEARFKQPARRRVKLELEHVEAIIGAALDAGRTSLALGTAIQFETGMRQRDVIGEWEPIGKDADGSGIVLAGRRWVNGLTWADLGGDFILHKVTTKTGAIVSHDFKLNPLIMGILGKIPADKRIGALIVDEKAGRPYAPHGYTREWRAIARKAGVPDHIWNMDARAGAITEAEDAGADLDTIRGAIGHTQASTTQRYSRGPIGKSREVAMMRAAHRAKRNAE